MKTDWTLCGCCRQSNTLQATLLDSPKIYIMLCEDCRENLDELQSDPNGLFVVIAPHWRGSTNVEIYSTNNRNMAFYVSDSLGATVYQRLPGET